MISHTGHDHPSTPSARAKCRRLHETPWPRPPLYSLGPPPATAKEVDLSEGGGHKAQTPRDRALQCDVCGVERIKWRGLDVVSHLILYVGPRCFYMVKRDPDGPKLISKRG